MSGGCARPSSAADSLLMVAARASPCWRRPEPHALLRLRGKRRCGQVSRRVSPPSRTSLVRSERKEEKGGQEGKKEWGGPRGEEFPESLRARGSRLKTKNRKNQRIIPLVHSSTLSSTRQGRGRHRDAKEDKVRGSTAVRAPETERSVPMPASRALRPAPAAPPASALLPAPAAPHQRRFLRPFFPAVAIAALASFSLATSCFRCCTAAAVYCLRAAALACVACCSGPIVLA